MYALEVPETEDRRTRIHRRRHLISEVLVAALVAVAYEQPVSVVITAVHNDGGISTKSLALFVVFFLTVLRFFIGDILHLDEDELSEPRDDLADKGAEARWFFDLAWIVLEFMILIFLGHLVSLEESQHVSIGFFGLLIVLMAVDVSWICAMGIMSCLGNKYKTHPLWGLWRRTTKTPWGWAMLNASLGVALIWYVTATKISSAALLVLVGINVVVFFVDVVILNYYMGRRAMSEDTSDAPQPQVGMTAAISQARSSEEEGGIPIGAALVDADGTVIGAGHNLRVQEGVPVFHAEIACLAAVGRRRSYKDTTLYSTLMPCYMCAGAIIQFGIPSVIVGESANFAGAAALLAAHGVQVTRLEDEECIAMLRNFINTKPDVWYEDIGEPAPSAA